LLTSSDELTAIADHFRARREAVLQTWRAAIRRDPAITTGDSLPKVDLYDHIPALLSTFERELRNSTGKSADAASEAGVASAAAHGLQRWQQGYDLREVTRELGKLNESVVAELESFAGANPAVAGSAISAARRAWAALCSTGIEESVGQYFQLQQREAAGHLKDLEATMTELRALELERADLWRQAAHDLRGNLGVVANATVGLTHSGLQESSRDEFVRILMRNVTSIHHLLDDVTSLARLQAGHETRRVEPIDVTAMVQQLCEGIAPVARQRRLFLHCAGPDGFAAEGDAVKIRRIAQNLILNAVKYTREGGVSVSWGDSAAHDAKRWELCISDTGPGIQSRSGQPLAYALEKAHEQSPTAQNDVSVRGDSAELKISPEVPRTAALQPPRESAGEGIGLSIVKRLCDMLDATIEMTSEQGVGTTFRILFPRAYDQVNS
jgi:signal transduction histidine kinase